MTFHLFAFPFKLWQGSIFCVSNSTSVPASILQCFVVITYSGMVDIFRHFLLEYCSLAQHFRSVTTKHFFNLTFLNIERSDSILVIYFLTPVILYLQGPESYQIFVGSLTECQLVLLQLVLLENIENMLWCRIGVTIEKSLLRFTYQSFLHTSTQLNVT